MFLRINKKSKITKDIACYNLLTGISVVSTPDGVETHILLHICYKIVVLSNY